MRARLRNLLGLVPALGLAVSCDALHSPFAEKPPPGPPPPSVAGALVAPPVAAGPVYSGSSTAPGALRLSASDVLGLLANNTAIGLTDVGATYQVYFAKSGDAHFRTAEVTDNGTWRVLGDGELCAKLGRITAGTETCYVLTRYGDVILFARPDGIALGSIRVVAGNPQSL